MYGCKSVEELSDEQIREVKKIFDDYDADKKGFIKTCDLGDVLRMLYQTPTDLQLQKLVEKFDVDGTGRLDFPEFLVIFVEQMKPTKNDYALRSAFQSFDPEGTGQIATKDLRYIMSNFGEQLTAEELEEMISEADIGGDGIIYYDDFVTRILSC